MDFSGINCGSRKSTGSSTTIKWTTLWGESVGYDTTAFLPSPNLWERLADAGVEPITVQPGNFLGSPLSKALYRGCRIEAAFTLEETVDATVQLAAEPNRFVFSYLPHVGFRGLMSTDRNRSNTRKR